MHTRVRVSAHAHYHRMHMDMDMDMGMGIGMDMDMGNWAWTWTHLGGVQVAALDLAVRLVGLAETSLEAHEGLGALLVREATRELDVALGEEALAGLDDASVDGASGVREGEGERGGGGEGGDAAAELLPQGASPQLPTLLLILVPLGWGAGRGGRRLLGGGAHDDRGGETPVRKRARAHREGR